MRQTLKVNDTQCVEKVVVGVCKLMMATSLETKRRPMENIRGSRLRVESCGDENRTDRSSLGNDRGCARVFKREGMRRRLSSRNDDGKLTTYDRRKQEKKKGGDWMGRCSP